jgi:hypothetical protein
MAQAGDVLLDTVKKVLHERIVPEILESTEIMLSTLTSDPTITGAAAAAAQPIPAPSVPIRQSHLAQTNMTRNAARLLTEQQ